MSRKQVIAAAAVSIEKNSGLKPAVIDKSLSRDKAHEQLRKIGSRAGVTTQAQSKSAVKPLEQSKPRQIQLSVNCIDHDVKKIAKSSIQTVTTKSNSDKLAVRITSSMLPKDYQLFKVQMNSQIVVPIVDGKSVIDLDIVRQIDSVDAGKAISALKLLTPSVTNKGEYYGFEPWPAGVSSSHDLDKMFTERLLEKINLVRPFFNASEMSFGSPSDIAWSTDVSALGLGFELPPEAIADLTMSVWLAGLDRRKVLIASASDFVKTMNCHIELLSSSKSYGKYDIYSKLMTVVYDFHVDVSFT